MRKANEESSIVDEGASPSSSVSRRRVLRGALGVAAGVAGTGRAAAQDAATPVPAPTGQVRTFPMPGTKTHSHLTQITFRGEGLQSLGPVSVDGSESGAHSGIQVRHSDGNGVSWLPDFAFRAGEEISVRTRLDIAGVDEGDFSFSCVVPRELGAAPERNSPVDEDLVHSFRTRPGLVPPIIEAERYEVETAPGYLFTAPKRGTGRNGALIMDDDGEPIWFFPVEAPVDEIYDFRVMEVQGEPMLVWWQGVQVTGHGFGHWVVYNTAYEPVVSLQIGNGYAGGDMHDIAITPQNTALIGAYNSIYWDLSPLEGPEEGILIDSVIQEIDLATGAVIFEWHSLDHVALEETYSPIEEEDFRGSSMDYFHFNAIAVDDDDHLIITARNTWATYKIHRATGEVIWRLGGKRSDFEMGEGTEGAYHHDARPLPNGEISFFDNGAAPKVHDASRGLVLALDMEEMTATVAREYFHPDGTSSGSQGNMQVLPNGNVLIGWGSEPLISEFAEDGTLLADWRLPEEKQSYRSYRFEWTGRPSYGPAAVVELGTVYVSWNGATEVVEWRVLTGDSEDDLSPAADPTPRTGFETEILLAEPGRYVAVEALDSQGDVLAVSGVIEL